MARRELTQAQTERLLRAVLDPGLLTPYRTAFANQLQKYARPKLLRKTLERLGVSEDRFPQSKAGRYLAGLAFEAAVGGGR